MKRLRVSGARCGLILRASAAPPAGGPSASPSFRSSASPAAPAFRRPPFRMITCCAEKGTRRTHPNSRRGRAQLRRRDPGLRREQKRSKPRRRRPALLAPASSPPQRARPHAAGAPLPPRRKSEASSRTRAFRRPLPAAPCSEKLEAFKMSGLPTPQANSCATCNYVMRWLTGSRERMLDDFRSLAVSGRFGPPCDSLAHFNAAAGGYAAAPGPAKTSPIYFNRVV